MVYVWEKWILTLRQYAEGHSTISVSLLFSSLSSRQKNSERFWVRLPCKLIREKIYNTGCPEKSQIKL